MKFNPYRPNTMAGPGMFVGRQPELQNIEQCLLQTKFGNPQSFLIHGERGIGKSSLFLYVDVLASGKMDKFLGHNFNFISVSIDCARCESQIELIQRIGKAIRSALIKHKSTQESARAFWDWLTDWEVLGIKFNKAKAEDRKDDILLELSEKINSYFDTDFPERCADGFLILIDECDKTAEQVDLGEFLKTFSERLTRMGCGKVCFGLAGLPDLLPKLRSSHESSPRLFQIMKLEPLTESERIEVIDIGLKEGIKANAVKIEIEDDASLLIAELSEGYPHFLQQFSYCAFDEDTDNNIDREDVMKGAYGEHGAISQLGDKFFNEMYHARISSDNYRLVLDAMANHGDDWIARKDIVSESGIGEKNTANALSTLKTKQVIIHDDSKRGMYRLPTRSFAAWINATKDAH